MTASFKLFKTQITNRYHIRAYGAFGSADQVISFWEKAPSDSQLMGQVHTFTKLQFWPAFRYWSDRDFAAMKKINLGPHSMPFEPPCMHYRDFLDLLFSSGLESVTIIEKMSGYEYPTLNRMWESDLPDTLWQGAYDVFANAPAELFHDPNALFNWKRKVMRREALPDIDTTDERLRRSQLLIRQYKHDSEEHLRQLTEDLQDTAIEIDKIDKPN